MEGGEEGGWQFVVLSTGRYDILCTEQDAGTALIPGS